jgi:hypothetical protein
MRTIPSSLRHIRLYALGERRLQQDVSEVIPREACFKPRRIFYDRWPALAPTKLASAVSCGVRATIRLRWIGKYAQTLIPLSLG